MAANAEAVDGKTLSNTATLAMPPGYVNSAFNNKATVQATAALALTETVGLAVTETDSAGGSSVIPTTGTAVAPGNPVTYSITVSNSNLAPSDATNVQVTDQLGGGISAVSWTGSNNTSGTGTLNATIADLRPARRWSSRKPPRSPPAQRPTAAPRTPPRPKRSTPPEPGP